MTATPEPSGSPGRAPGAATAGGSAAAGGSRAPDSAAVGGSRAPGSAAASGTSCLLADLTTIGLGGPTPALWEATTVAELSDALHEARGFGGALVIGGGSNLVVADGGIDVPVVRVAIGGVRIEPVSGESAPGYDGPSAPGISQLGGGDAGSGDGGPASDGGASFGNAGPAGGGGSREGAGPGFRGGASGVKFTDGAPVDAIAVIGAGVNWDDAVAEIVAAGYAGVAELSGIPGLAGATPVQNVGAYGVEIADVLIDVELLQRVGFRSDPRAGAAAQCGGDDGGGGAQRGGGPGLRYGAGLGRDAARLLRVPARELGLTYRHSVLKGTDAAVVTEIRLRLTRQPTPVRYPELARLLGVAVGEGAPSADVREAVLELRRSKGMVLDAADPDTRSAGSFFTNPIVGADQLERVRAAVARRLGDDVRMPEYPVIAPRPARAELDGKPSLDSDRRSPTWGNGGHAEIERGFTVQGATKLSAAWLIERAGFTKGFPLRARPKAGIALSTKHTLALTNRGHGTTAELVALAREIRAEVLQAFGVLLQPEPLLIGCSLD